MSKRKQAIKDRNRAKKIDKNFDTNINIKEKDETLTYDEQTIANVKSYTFRTLNTAFDNVSAYATSKKQKSSLEELYPAAYDKRVQGSYSLLNKYRVFYKALMPRFNEIKSARIALEVTFKFENNGVLQAGSRTSGVREIIRSDGDSANKITKYVKDQLVNDIVGILEEFAGQYQVSGKFFVNSIIIKLFPVLKISGKSYFEHNYIKEHPRVFFSPKNEDSKCFLYAVILSLIWDRPDIITPDNKKHINRNELRFTSAMNNIILRMNAAGIKIDDSMLTYPVDIYHDTEAIELFQNKNSIALTIHNLVNLDEGYSVENVYLNTDEQLRNRVYIMRITDEQSDATHFVTVKDQKSLISLFFNHEKNNTDKYCQLCLKLKDVDKPHICQEVTCKIENIKPFYYMPKEGTKWGFVSSKHKYSKKKQDDVATMVPSFVKNTLKVRYVCFFDFEAINKKIIKDLNTYDHVGEEFIKRSEVLNEQYAAEYSIIFVDRYEKKTIYSKYYKGEQCLYQFQQSLKEISNIFNGFINADDKGYKIDMSKADEELFQLQDKCIICNRKFGENDKKVRHHDHQKSADNFIGAAHNSCNLKCESQNKLPIFAHNFSGYDAHLVVQSLDYYDWGKDEYCRDINTIMTSSNKFKCLEFDIFQFRDSYAHCSRPLFDLVKYLRDSNEEFIFTNAYARQMLEARGIKYSDDIFKKYFAGKIVFPYEQMTDFGVYDRKALFNIEDFASKLNNGKTITQQEYNDYLDTHKFFKFATHGEYCELYNMLDTLLLADVMINYSDVLYKNYMIDPLTFNTIPAFGESAAIRESMVDIELFTDIDMYETAERTKRGGMSFSIERECIPKNELTNFYHKGPISDGSIGAFIDNAHEYVDYLDLNQMYATKMLEPLPHSDFRYMDKKDIEYINVFCKKYELSRKQMFSLNRSNPIVSYDEAKRMHEIIYDCENPERVIDVIKFDLINDGFIPVEEIMSILNVNKSQRFNDADFEYIAYEKDGLKVNDNAAIFVVDLIPPKDPLKQMIIQNFMLAPENKEIHVELSGNLEAVKGVTKLTADFEDKLQYHVYYSNLLFYMHMGYTVRRIHKVLQFTERNFLASFVQKTIDLRNEAKRVKNGFKSDMFKLVNNALFGKTMQNVRNYEEFKFCKTVGKSTIRTNNHLVKQFMDPFFKDIHYACEKYVIVNSHQKLINLNKPIYIGATILEKSKMYIYKFYYQIFKPVFGSRMRLLATDTDSMILRFITDNYYREMSKIKSYLDLDKKHPCHVAENAGASYKIKDELGSDNMVTEFYSNAAKSYIMNVIKRDELNVDVFFMETLKKIYCNGSKNKMLKAIVEDVDGVKKVTINKELQQVGNIFNRAMKDKFITMRKIKAELQVYENPDIKDTEKVYFNKKALKGVSSKCSEYYSKDDSGNKSTTYDILQAFRDSVNSNVRSYTEMVNINSEEHRIYLKMVEKLAVSPDDDKRALVPVYESDEQLGITYHYIETRPYLYALNTPYEILCKYEHKEQSIRAFSYTPRVINIEPKRKSNYLKDRVIDGEEVEKGIANNFGKYFIGRSEELGANDVIYNSYYSYPWNEVNGRPNNIRHEIIGREERKIVIDVDLKGNYPEMESIVKHAMYDAFLKLYKVGNILQLYEDINFDNKLDVVKSRVSEEFFNAYMDGFIGENSKKVFLDNVLTFSASGLTEHGYKTSFHLLIDFLHVKCADDARVFAEAVKKAVLERTENKLYAESIDTGIYKINQSLRVYGASKPHSARVKCADRELEFKKSLVSYIYECIPLPKLGKTAWSKEEFKDKENTPKYVANKTDTVAINNIIENKQEMAFIKNAYSIESKDIKGFYKLIRKSSLPYHCDCCKRTHDSPNAVWAWMLGKDNTITIGCFRDKIKTRIKVQL